MDSLLWYPGHQLILEDIVRAEGAWIFAADGRRWCDLESGVWAASVGQTHPRIARALAAQDAAVAHAGFNWTAPVVREAVAAVLRVLDLGEGARATLLCSGSEAVEYCIRCVSGLLPRPKLLTLADSYFGAYGAAHGRAAERWETFAWLEDCADCPADRSCDETCPKFRAIPFLEIGAFVFEPGSSSGFVRFPPAKLIEAIAARVQQGGGFLVVNEVTTGVGRTGRWFGWRHYDVAPDAVALGKGVGGGYPVAVAAVGPRVAARLDGPPAYAQSHQNDPLGAAVLLAVLGVIADDDLIARGRAVGERLAAGLRGLQERTGRPAAVRARGPLIALDLAGGPAEAAAVHRALLDAGWIVGLRPGTATLRLDPPLNLADEDADGFLEALGAILAG